MKDDVRKGSGMKEKADRYSDAEVLKHNNKRMYGVNTMSEDYDMGRVQILPTTLRGDPPQAWDYEY